jgi:hypothetical protein
MKKRLFLIGTFIFCSIYCFAQSQPVLEITSPPTGTTVSPGQTIVIIVSADPSISNVGIIPQRPLKFSQILRPLEFSVTVPTNTPFGQYKVTAVGVAPRAQEPTFSKPIYLNVERLELPVSLKTETSLKTFEAIGDSLPLWVTGIYSDGSQADLTYSQQTIYSSSDTSVATVNSRGMITAKGVGQTDIKISNGAASCSVHVIVERPVCRIRGEGYLYPEKKPNKADFSLFVTTGPVAIASGRLKYSYAKVGLNFEAFQYTAASVSGRTGTISGVGIVNGTIGYKFTVTVKDKPHDTYSIQIFNPDGSLYYSAGPERIKEGNLEVICRESKK